MEDVDEKAMVGGHRGGQRGEVLYDDMAWRTNLSHKVRRRGTVRGSRGLRGTEKARGKRVYGV